MAGRVKSGYNESSMGDGWRLKEDRDDVFDSTLVTRLRFLLSGDLLTTLSVETSMSASQSSSRSLYLVLE